MELRTEYLHIRLSQTQKLRLQKLAELSHYSISQYISRLIDSTYFRYFDKEGNLIYEDEKTNFNY